MACKFSIADKHFSRFVRLRDADDNGYCRCITCGKIHHWKEMDCGHFMTRDRPATRFNEQNCHAQCKYCNNYKKGEQYKHGVEIDNLYGAGTAEKLSALSNIRGQKIHTKLSIKDLAKTYLIKVKELAKQKGIEL